MGNKKLLLLPEVAARLGKTESALRWGIHNGTAPPSAVIMGRRVWVEDKLDAWIDQQFETAS